MGRISDWLHKNAKEYFDDDPYKRNISHVSSYHTFFRGYSEEKRVGGGKKGYHIERVYTADYLAFTSEKKIWLLNKLFYTVLFILACVFAGLTLSVHSGCSSAVYVVAPTVAELILLAITFVWILNYDMAPLKMTLGIYATGPKRLRTYSMIAAVCSLLSVLMILVYFVLHIHEIDWPACKVLIFEVLSAASLIVIHQAEKSKKYERIANSNEVPYNSNEIW